MSRPRTVLITVGKRSAFASPTTGAVRAAIRRIGSPSQYHAATEAISIPMQRAGDLAAALESVGIRVDLEQVIR